jgi:hypothetical protein
VNDVALADLADGFLELDGAGGVEKLQKPCDRAADVVAAVGDDVKERPAAADGAREAIEATVLAGAPLLGGQPLEMVGLLVLLAAVPGAWVRRDDLVAVDDPHLVERGRRRRGSAGTFLSTKLPRRRSRYRA